MFRGDCDLSHVTCIMPLCVFLLALCKPMVILKSNWPSILISFMLIYVFLRKPIWVNIYMEFPSAHVFCNTIGSYIFVVFFVGLQ